MHGIAAMLRSSKAMEEEIRKRIVDLENVVGQNCRVMSMVMDCLPATETEGRQALKNQILDSLELLERKD